MNEAHAATENHSAPERYEIRLKGHLDARWADWFAGMAITLAENGDTLLTGPVADQAALHGLLRKVRDLAMPLISLNGSGSNAHDCHAEQSASGAKHLAASAAQETLRCGAG